MDNPHAMVVNGKVVAGGHDSRLVPWWSFTKTILAAAALALVRDGYIALDDRVGNKPYTLRQLLRHTAGLADYSELNDYQPAVEGTGAPWPAEEMLARVKADQLRFDPGTKWKYSNTGYFVVRRLIEDTTGEDMQQALENLVLRPLGVHGVLLATARTDMATTAWGNPTNYHPGWVYHGLLIGPPAAAALALDRLLRGSLLPAELLTDMLHQIPLGHEIPGRPGLEYGYGMGLMIALDGPAGRSVGHTGHDFTSVAAVYHFPDLSPARTVAAFARGGSQAEVEWAAVNYARAPVSFEEVSK
jgi:D-alanyl-D-alanine carboxypeptidase